MREVEEILRHIESMDNLNNYSPSLFENKKAAYISAYKELVTVIEASNNYMQELITNELLEAEPKTGAINNNRQ